MSFLVTILANKSNTFGIAKDVEAVRYAFGGKGVQIRVCDPLEPPTYTDVAVHLEVPVYVWMPWAAKNIMVVNPEWFVLDAWRPYLSKFDHIVVKEALTAKLLAEDVSAEKIVTIPWALPSTGNQSVAKSQRSAFLWLLGASRSKRAYVPILLNAWKAEYPPLLITTTTPLDLSGTTVGPNVEIHVGDLTKDERARLSAEYKGHVCCSQAEGFGYTAAEAEAAGAYTILNSIPVYVSDYQKDFVGAKFLPASLKRTGLAYTDTGLADIGGVLDSAMDEFAAYTEKDAKERRVKAKVRWDAFKMAWDALMRPFLKVPRPAALKTLPPRQDAADCPNISVVTLVYNRKKFFDLACHNILVTDYPKDKIEWIVVDDSDDPAEQNSDRIVAVGNAAAPIKFIYVPLKKKTAVSEKRNVGVEKASADIVLFMDDDDHYPETSFRRRVGWLLNHPWKPRAAACTTIACYDLLKGISAVNVPPMDLPLGQRISEATLTFYKSWWAEKKFPAKVVVGEAEEFLAGREVDLIEMPPQQIIVAFSHGKNVSSRRVPSDADVTPGCFWGFPREFLEFVHGLAGVKVVGA